MDHKNLEALKTPWKLSPKQVRWAQYFQHFNFTLRYLQGKNILADALSRPPQYNSNKPEIIKPLLPASQLVARVMIRAQMKGHPPPMDNIPPPKHLNKLSQMVSGFRATRTFV